MIANPCFHCRSDAQRLINPAKVVIHEIKRERVFVAAADGLHRFYQSHRDDPDTSLDETLQAYAQLMEQGKVRAIGASNYSAERLSYALALSRRDGLPSYECLQMEYNLYDRAEYQETREPVCIENGLGVLSYFSLASGFLTGKYQSAADVANKARGDFVKRYLNQRGFRILNVLDQVAKRLHATPAQVALAWLIAPRTITAPIASATSLAQLNELIGATKLELDETSMVLLNRASDGLGLHSHNGCTVTAGFLPATCILAQNTLGISAIKGRALGPTEK